MSFHSSRSRPAPAILAALLLPLVLAAEPATSAPTVTDGNSEFAADLYRQLAAGSGNLFFSPYSISTALAMALDGARGQTAAGMADALQLATLSRGQIAAGFADLQSQLGDANGNGIRLVPANSLWIQSGFPFDHAYLDSLRRNFGAEANPVDFIDHSAAAQSAINRWVKSATRGKIAELVGPGTLDAATRMVLCNAVYFKGRWERPFPKGATESRPFHLGTGSTIMVPTMRQTAWYRRSSQANCDLLELPYAGRRLSMVIILPHGLDGLPAVERELSGDNLRRWLAGLDSSRAAGLEVSLPRFTATESYNLRTALTHMGMAAAFEPAAADFSGMTARRGLFLSAVLHRAYVKVDEEGTEAAAVTGGVMTVAAVLRVPEFRVDHPFIFLIRDGATGTILFLGRIVDPR